MPRESRRARAESRASRADDLSSNPNASRPTGSLGPPNRISPQADFMTQPVSNARWPHTDVSCFERPDAHETFSCDETHPLRCESRRAQLVAEPDRALARDADSWGLAFCRDADTVVEGFLCSEPTVVSNACRKPTNAFDAFVCDDSKMRELQWVILRETWSIVKALALGVLRGKP